MARRAVLVSVVLVLGLSVGVALWGAGNLAELSIREIVLDPPSLVTRGTQLNVVAHVANTGTRTAEHFETGLYFRPQQEGAPWSRLPGLIETPYLAPAEGREIELAFAVETMDWQPGTYEIRAVVDVGNAIQESDEFNNEFVVAMTLVESPAGLPDLQPVAIDFAPTDPNDETAPWTISVTVLNTGDEAAGPFRVTMLRNGLAFATVPQYGLPKSGEFTVNGTMCGNDASLASGSSVGCSGGLASGVYEIRALIDSGEEVAERDERNNSLVGTMSVQALELRPKSLSFDRSPVRLNEDVTLRAVVVNSGRGNAESVQVAFYVNGKQLDVVSVGPITYLGEVQAETVFNAARLGFIDAPEAYDVHVVVDPHDLLHETDEDNNALVRSMSVLEPLAELPELMPRSLGLYPASPVELGRAGQLTVTSTVLNSGRSPASDFDVRFYFRSKGASRWIPFPCVDETQCTAAALPAGGSVPFVGSLSTVGLSPGVYEIRVAADPDGRVEELDERNNELTTGVTLQAAQLPDLVACSPIASDPSYAVRRGRTITLSVCVTNEGDVAAGPFNVRFSHCPAPEVPNAQVIPCDSPSGYSALGLYPSVVSVAGLAPGQQTTITTRLETEELAPGAYYLSVELDADPSSSFGTIAESNEANNLAQGGLFVVGPDLAVVDVQIASPAAQTRLSEVAAIVSNLGQEAAGQFEVSFYVAPILADATATLTCDGRPDCTATLVTRVLVPGLAVDAFERVVCNLDTRPFGSGAYVLRAEVKLVEVPGFVPEHALLNNVLEVPLTPGGGSFTPGGPIDLAVQDVLVLPDTLSQGDHGVVRVFVSNVGTATVGDFYVEFTFTDSDGHTTTARERYVGAIEPGRNDARIVTDFDTSAFALGTVSVAVTIDPMLRLADTNRANNLGVQTFTVL